MLRHASPPKGRGGGAPVVIMLKGKGPRRVELETEKGVVVVAPEQSGGLMLPEKGGVEGVVLVTGGEKALEPTNKETALKCAKVVVGAAGPGECRLYHQREVQVGVHILTRPFLGGFRV